MHIVFNFFPPLDTQTVCVEVAAFYCLATVWRQMWLQETQPKSGHNVKI